MPEPNLTERQQKWFAAVQANLVKNTGKTMDAWVAIARQCPEIGQRAQLKWLKDNYGLLQNHGMQVLNELSGASKAWESPDALIAALWTDPASRAIFEAVDAAARRPNEVLQTARKSYTAWSRKVQFAAARPVKGGKLMLGLAGPPDASARLEAPKNESWSERLKARTLLAAPAQVDAEITALLKGAWDRA
jgi:Domain of unknown function (DUF4287)/Domain of unknown function (DUF5655)